MGRYFVRVVADALLPDSKPWCFVDDGEDVYFVVGESGAEIPPEVLDCLVDKVKCCYDRDSQVFAAS